MIRARVSRADGIAVSCIEPRLGDEGLGALIGPDGLDMSMAEVVHRLLHLSIALAGSEPDGLVHTRGHEIPPRAHLPLTVIKVVSLASGRGIVPVGSLLELARGQMFGLVHLPRCGILGNLLALVPPRRRAKRWRSSTLSTRHGRHPGGGDKGCRRGS